MLQTVDNSTQDSSSEQSLNGSDTLCKFRWHQVVIVCAVTIFVFAFTVYERRSWIGEMSEESHGHQWLTGSTLVWSRNWYRQGTMKHAFALFDNPRSIEFADEAARAPYVSYPPGSTLPIWMLALLIGAEPSVELIHWYNLTNQLAIAICLGMLGHLVCIRAPITGRESVLFACISALVYLLLPATMYFHLAVYAMDTAVLLPFALCLLLEVLRDHAKRPKNLQALSLLQGSVFFLGYLTDWLFVPVGGVFFLKRLWTGSLSCSKVGPLVLFWLPALLAACIFLTQVTQFNYWPRLIERFAARTGVSEGSTDWHGFAHFSHNYFSWRIPWAFGDGSQWILASATLAVIVLAFSSILKRTASNYAAVVVVLALVPCVFQLLLLHEHSGHAFSVVKLAIPLALIPFSLLPAMLLGQLRNASEAGENSIAKKTIDTATVFMIFVVAAYLLRSHNEFHDGRFFGGNPPSILLKNLEYEFAKARIDESDFVVSPNFEVPQLPPQRLSRTMKRVYCVKSEKEFLDRTEALPVPHRLVALIVNGDDCRFEYQQIESATDRHLGLHWWRALMESELPELFQSNAVLSESKNHLEVTD